MAGRLTQEKCPDCGQFLHDIAGIGEKEPNLKCLNPNCPGKYSKYLCPQCGSKEKDVNSRGIGDVAFRCKDCGHVWQKPLFPPKK